MEKNFLTGRDKQNGGEKESTEKMNVTRLLFVASTFSFLLTTDDPSISLRAGLQLTTASAQEQQVFKRYSFGDYTSQTLATKAWEALKAGDLDGVLVYTEKCAELYGKKAGEMQASLNDYVTGTDQEVFNQWALNDVATCYFIQGEAYVKAGLNDEAKEAYQTVIDQYGFAQCWDTRGWFWKPSESAKAKIAWIDSGMKYDLGDFSSVHLTSQAWKALGSSDLDALFAYTHQAIALYEKKALEQQASLTDFSPKGNEFDYWALNDIATCYFIQGEAYTRQKKSDEALAAYRLVSDEFGFAQCWDTRGWFWKVADAAKNRIQGIQSGEIYKYDFGDYSSLTLTVNAWKALEKEDLEAVVVYTNKCFELYGKTAKEQQASLTNFASGSNDEIAKHWALNDVGTCYFIRGSAFQKAGQIEEARKAFQTMLDNFHFAQCWDPKGWYWKVGDACVERLAEL